MRLTPEKDWQSWYYEWLAIHEGAEVCGLWSGYDSVGQVADCPRPKGHDGECKTSFPQPSWDIVHEAVREDS